MVMHCAVTIGLQWLRCFLTIWLSKVHMNNFWSICSIKLQGTEDDCDKHSWQIQTLLKKKRIFATIFRWPSVSLVVYLPKFKFSQTKDRYSLCKHSLHFIIFLWICSTTSVPFNNYVTFDWYREQCVSETGDQNMTRLIRIKFPVPYHIFVDRDVIAMWSCATRPLELKDLLHQFHSRSRVIRPVCICHTNYKKKQRQYSTVQYTILIPIGTKNTVCQEKHQIGRRL